MVEGVSWCGGGICRQERTPLVIVNGYRQSALPSASDYSTISPTATTWCHLSP